MTSNIKTGDIFTSEKYGDFEVVNYINSHNIIVKFIETGYTTSVQSSQIKLLSVADRYKPSVYGVGVIGDGVVKHKGKLIYEYKVWKGMLRRCYSEKWHKEKPSYADCEVSDNFKQFSYFKDWCNNQIGFSSKDDKGNYFALDKDILVKGNKRYSEETCCFIPQEINAFFISRKSQRGIHPIGVSYHAVSGKFTAQVSLYGKQHVLGCFKTEKEAFEAYKKVKEGHIKSLANKWKDHIDQKVYTKLMNFTIEITD